MEDLGEFLCHTDDRDLPPFTLTNSAAVRQTSTGCGLTASNSCSLEFRAEQGEIETSPCPTGTATDGVRKRVSDSFLLSGGERRSGRRELKAAGERSRRNGLFSILACIAAERAKEKAALKLACDGTVMLIIFINYF